MNKCMYPVLFKINNIEIRAFYVCYVLGFSTATIIFFILVRKAQIVIKYKILLTIIIFVSFIIGAKLLPIIIKGKITFSLSGFTFYGGLIFTFINTFIFSKLTKTSYLKLLDILAIVIPVAHGITRIGCLLGGCCFGKPTNLPWGIKYPENSFAYFKYNGAHLHPVPVYSMLGNFIIFAILLSLYNLYNKKNFDGKIILFYLIIYSFIRFFIEFFRGDYAHYYLGLTISQLISIVIFFIGIILLYIKFSQEEFYDKM